MNGRLATERLSVSVVPVPLTICRPSVPTVVPTFALTVRVVPLPVTVTTLAPVPPVSAKFDALTPVTLLLKVTVQATVAALVGFAPARTIERTLAGTVMV